LTYNAKNKVLKVNSGSYDDKDMDSLDNLMLTYPVIKSIIVPLFVLPVCCYMRTNI